MIRYHRESITQYKALIIFAYGLLLILISGGLINYTNSLKYIYHSHFPLSHHLSTLLVEIHIICYFLLQIPAGLLIDRININKSILSALSCYLIGMFIFAISNNFTLFLIARIIMTIGTSFAFILTVFIARELFPDRWFFYLVSCAKLVFALSIALSPYLINKLASFFSWRMISVVFVLCFFTLLTLYFRFRLPKHVILKDENTFVEKNIFQHIKNVVVSFSFWQVCLTAGLFYTHFTIFTEINAPAYIQKVYHLDYIHSISLDNMALYGYMVGCLALGPIEHLLKTRMTFVMAALFSTLAYSIIAFYHPMLKADNLVKLSLYFILGFFSPFVLTVFRLYQIKTGKTLNATTNACIVLVTCLTPLALMNIYYQLWQISFADTRYFMFVCYAVSTVLGFALFLGKPRGPQGVKSD